MSWFQSIRERITKTSNNISNNVSRIFSSSKKIDLQTLEELEEMLLLTDMGPEIAISFTEKLKITKFNSVMNEDDIKNFLKNEIYQLLFNSERDLNIVKGRTNVIMLCGVNGNGKTTTAGKLAMQFKNQGYSVMLGACDTFRAAAVEQLQEWGHRVDCPVIVGNENADSASVGYKAFTEAKDNGIDILILDTAGRLHNKANLMNELQKSVRVLKKIDDTAPHEIIMVVDSTTGQNAYSQIQTFNEMISISSLVFTKLDSTAKGGVVIGAVKKYNIPIYGVGVGESIDDLRKFNSKDFAESIL